MKEQEFAIALHLDGAFVKDESVTARTLGHSLTSLQRMVDKAVIFDRRGSVKKGDALPAAWYEEADLIVKPFRKGCVTVPLASLKNQSVIGLLKGVVHDPYEEAISDAPVLKKKLLDGFGSAYNKAAKRAGVITHQALIQDAAAREKRYFAESIVKDLNQLISPLRSSAVTDAEIISIELKDKKGVKEYEFNRTTSKRFNKIVSSRQFGPIVHYSGRLTEFGETRYGDFPYSGRFYSNDSKHEHKLLVPKDLDVNKLRMFNTNKKMQLNFIGSPISVWGAFDEQKGDIVFLKLAD